MLLGNTWTQGLIVWAENVWQGMKKIYTWEKSKPFILVPLFFLQILVHCKEAPGREGVYHFQILLGKKGRNVTIFYFIRKPLRRCMYQRREDKM